MLTGHPSVAGAAALAGLLVAGGAYAARHDVGLGTALQASAVDRARLVHDRPLGRESRGATHTLVWRPPHAPKIHVRSRPRFAAGGHTTYVQAAPVVTTGPVTRTSPAPPTTRTSPVGGDDGEGGGDD